VTIKALLHDFLKIQQAAGILFQERGLAFSYSDQMAGMIARPPRIGELNSCEFFLYIAMIFRFELNNGMKIKSFLLTVFFVRDHKINNLQF
jgi:hypothetical protein